MKLVGYARVDPELRALPIDTQQDACKDFATNKDHEIVSWCVDECGDSALLERDGFQRVIQRVLEENVDGILVYEWTRISEEKVQISALKPLFYHGIGETLPLYTPDGKVEFHSSEDPEKVLLDEAMGYVVNAMDQWEKTISNIKKRESLQELIDTGNRKRIGRPPFGLETDKKRFENRKKVHKYYPDDRGQVDKFRIAIEILNEFSYNDTTPYTPTSPSATEISNEYGVDVSVVETIWEYRDTYRKVAKSHRDGLTLLF